MVAAPHAGEERRLPAAAARARHMARASQSEPEIDVDKCKSGESTNLFTNSTGPRLRVQKIELPPSKDGKKYNPEEAEKAWCAAADRGLSPRRAPPGRDRTPHGDLPLLLRACRKDFFTKFPDMRAWEIEFNPKKDANGNDVDMEQQLVDTLEKNMARNEGEWEKATDEQW